MNEPLENPLPKLYKMKNLHFKTSYDGKDSRIESMSLGVFILFFMVNEIKRFCLITI